MTLASYDTTATTTSRPVGRQTTRHSVLVCDDEELIRWSLSEHLRGEGYNVTSAKNGSECIEVAARSHPDVILLDLKMPVLDGLTALRRMRDAGVQAPVIVITAQGAVESAIEATRLGAVGYITKPFDLREVSLKVNQVLTADRMATEVHYLREKRRDKYGRIFGESEAMHTLFDAMHKLENIDAPAVLVTGESGAGKGLVAQAIHANSPRKDEPFVEIDCGSMSETQLESELFGHERGAFADARAMKRGLFEVAHKGTILLEEIGAMSLATQARLLRALESRRFKRIGGTIEIAFDANIIATSHRDLAADVEKGRFRHDLFYRLAALTITLPPMRNRAGDLPVLAARFLDQSRRRNPGRIESISPEAMKALQAYSWPGNVRELRNVIERMATLHRNEPVIQVAHLPSEVRTPNAGETSAVANGGPFILPEGGVDLEKVEKSLLMQALERVKQNQTQAAKLLGITRYALRYRMEKFGLKN